MKCWDRCKHKPSLAKEVCDWYPLFPCLDNQAVQLTQSSFGEWGTAHASVFGVVALPHALPVGQEGLWKQRKAEAAVPTVEQTA